MHVQEGAERWDPSSVNLLRQMSPAVRAAPSWEKSQEVASHSPQRHIKPATVYVQSQIHSVHQLQSSKSRCLQLIIPAHFRVTSSSEG